MSSLSNQRGSALLEVLITGVIFAIAVIGLTSMFSLGQTFMVAQGDEWVALYLAQQKIEELTGAEFSTVSPSTQLSIPAGVSGTQTFDRVTTVDCLDPANYTTPITCPTPPAPILVKRVTVTVTPTSMIQTTPVTLATFLTSH
jgi:hypothetical protein